MIPDLDHMADLNAEDHTYTVQTDPTTRYCSVTQLVKGFSRPFQEDLEAAKYSVKHRMKKKDVLQLWADKRNNAANLGTIVHAIAENIAHNLREHGWYDPVTPPGPAAGYVAGVHRFYDEHLEAGLAGPVPELRVASPTWRLAGTVDLITGLDGEPAILDWKTSERIDRFGFGSKCMYAPFNHLPDSNFWHYLLQLNTYRYILKKEYDYEVNQLAVIWLLPDGSYRIKSMEIAPDELLEKGFKKNLRKMKKDEQG